MPTTSKRTGGARLSVFPRTVIWWGLLGMVAVCAVIVAPVSAEQGASTGPRTCLWSVDGDGGRVYLLGSVHFLRDSDYPLPEPMEAAYRRSRKIVFETDIGSMADPALQARMLRLGTYPEGEDVFGHLHHDTRTLLEQKLDALGIPQAAIARLRPWALAVTLAATELKHLGFAEDAGVDRHFFRKAKADGKAVAFLESNEFQVDLLAGLDGPDQDAYLHQTLKELDQLEGLAPEMVTLWRTGDRNRLHAVLIENVARHPELRERFLIRRNHRWVRHISAFIEQQQNVLVVVGALHLVGPESVVDLLEALGHRVRQH